MRNLLNFFLDAHGGLKRWNGVQSVTLAAAIGGETWRDKSKFGYLKSVLIIRAATCAAKKS